MRFSPDVTLARLVSNMNNNSLLHEFNPKADPIEIRSRSENTYEAIMSFRTLMFTTRVLSHCREEDPGQVWHRRCDLDPSELDGGKYQDRKYDEIFCNQRSPGELASCTLEMGGNFKDQFFMKSSVISVWAKYQALINWGRFFYLLETGGISTRYSNALFDRSSLKEELDRMRESGLAQAKTSTVPFHFSRKASFSGPAIR